MNVARGQIARNGGSHRRRKAVAIPAKLHREPAARRNDCSHRQANAVLSKTQHVAVEDLNIEGIGRTRLAKPVYDAAWRRFLDILGYKAANAGGGIEKVDPRHTSQARSGRGALVLKTLGDRRHDCPACGASLDRDVNAAKNILIPVGTRPSDAKRAGYRKACPRSRLL